MKRTLTKGKLLITIWIIALLAVYVHLGMGYMGQVEEHEALTSQIAGVRQALAQIPEAPQYLEQQLAAAEASLAAVQDAFPSRINSTEVIEAILELAENTDVKAIPLGIQPWSIETVGEHNYGVLRLTAAVQGGFSQLLSFVSQLENGEFKTLIVENLSVTRVAGRSEKGSIPEEITPVTASLNLVIHSRPPTPD